MIIWITGLSGSGKTTLCEAVLDVLKPTVPELMHVDGDVIREFFGSDLSFVEADRIKQIKRIQSISSFLYDQGQIVLVAALYASPELLAENRRLFADYFEVYIEAPMDMLSDRNSKGLYDNSTPNVVGVDIPWYAPKHADLRFDATKGSTSKEMANVLIEAIPSLAKRR